MRMRRPTHGNSAGDLACLIPYAHLEIWHGSDIDIVTYFKDKNICKEVKAAFNLFIDSPDDGQQVQGRYSSAAWRMWADPVVLFTKAKIAVT